ncbi:MAG TPA: hypothetical protein VEO53_01980, partial [Candidatus Binatia bacterium]|nr:hypothetical protein [Candidatus Binatia bacterium]
LSPINLPASLYSVPAPPAAAERNGIGGEPFCLSKTHFTQITSSLTTEKWLFKFPSISPAPTGPLPHLSFFTIFHWSFVIFSLIRFDRSPR